MRRKIKINATVDIYLERVIRRLVDIGKYPSLSWAVEDALALLLLQHETGTLVLSPQCAEWLQEKLEERGYSHQDGRYIREYTCQCKGFSETHKTAIEFYEISSPSLARVYVVVALHLDQKDNILATMSMTTCKKLKDFVLKHNPRCLEEYKVLAVWRGNENMLV